MHTGVDICAVFFDLRKAFDSVSHRALIQKLSKLDLPPLLFQWLQDYLTGRFQQVAIGALGNIQITSCSIGCASRVNTWSVVVHLFH